VMPAAPTSSSIPRTLFGGVGLARPVGPLFEVGHPALGCESKDPQIPVLLLTRRALEHVDAHDGDVVVYREHSRVHRERPASVLEPERLDCVVSDF
jgi:hypothetical protein